MWEAEAGSPLRNFHSSNWMIWRVWAGRVEVEIRRRRERYFKSMSVRVLIDDGGWGLVGCKCLTTASIHGVTSFCWA